MIEWNEESTDEKTYMYVVIYLKNQQRTIGQFELAGWGVSTVQGFESTNTVAEIQTACMKQPENNQEKPTNAKQKL